MMVSFVSSRIVFCISGEDAMKITYDAEQLMASEDTIQ